MNKPSLIVLPRKCHAMLDVEEVYSYFYKSMIDFKEVLLLCLDSFPGLCVCATIYCIFHLPSTWVRN